MSVPTPAFSSTNSFPRVPLSGSKSSAALHAPVPHHLAPVAGGGIGNGSISPISPWTTVVPIYNRDTSYGRTYNLDHGEFHRARVIEKRLAFDNPHGFQASGVYKPKAIMHYNSSQKQVSQYADKLTESLLRLPKSLTAYDQNRQLNIKEDSVKIDTSPLPPWQSPQHISRLSQENEKWLKTQEQKAMSRKFSQGEFIPNMNQLQLYGRRETKSK